MKYWQQLARLLALALTVCCLASCGAPADTDQTTTAASSSLSAEVAPTETQPTETTTKVEKTTKAKKKTEKDEPDLLKEFVYGLWNDGSHLEYSFNADGTGTRTDTAADTTDSFRFEVNEKKGTVTITTDDGKKQKADYANADETHMTLTFSKNETVELTYGALIRKGNTPFRMGTWKSVDGALYVFRPDGSGAVTYPEPNDGGTPFQYEVNPESNLLILHFGTDDEAQPAVYTLSGDGKYMTIAFEYDYAELQWQSDSTK